jgi:hypothetical protein
MDKKRILSVIVGATLIIAVVLVALGYNAAPKATGSSVSSTGFGDLRRFENQSALSGKAVTASSYYDASIGNLRRFEGQPSLVTSRVQGNSATSTGMGDLRRYEAKQVITAPEAEKYGPPGR